MDNYKIVSKYGHYVVLDDNGDFVCSADTYKEAKEDIESMERNVSIYE